MSIAAEVHVHRDDPDTVGRRERMGVLLLIVADVAFVACLMFSYLYLRFLNVNGLWLPADVTPALTSPTWLVAGALVIGAAVFTFGARQHRTGNKGILVVAAVIALLASIVAVVLQYGQIVDFDFPTSDKGFLSSAYSSSMLALAGANLFHIAVTAFVTAGIANRARIGRYAEPPAWQPVFVSYWWIWVAISAVLVGLMTTFLVGSPSPPSMG